MSDVLRKGLERIQPGDHIVFIYENTRELIGFAVPFVKDGLTNGERCLYVVDDLKPSEVREALLAGRVDVKREIEHGALVLLDAREYYGLPPLDAVRVLELARKRVGEARARGFTGLRVAVEMTWARRGGGADGAAVEDETLAGYESLVDIAFVEFGLLTAACMYRRDRFSPALLQRQIRSHAKVVAHERVYLSLSALFRDLARTDLEQLAQSARDVHVPRGEFYFHQGASSSEAYFLLRGAVKLFRTDDHGRNMILRIVQPAEPFGDRTALGRGANRLSSAQALEDTRALVWDSETLRRAILTHPAVSMRALDMLEDRVEEERSRLQELVTSSAEERLARTLLRFVRSHGHKTRHGVAIELPLSGQDLADLILTTPYTVSRILAEWKRLDIVDRINGRHERVVVLDERRLAAIAGAGTGRGPLTASTGYRHGRGPAASRSRREFSDAKQTIDKSIKEGSR